MLKQVNTIYWDNEIEEDEEYNEYETIQILNEILIY